MSKNCGLDCPQKTSSTSPWSTRRHGFKLSLLKVLASLPSLGLTAEILDSTDAVIEAGFTYEYFDETCASQGENYPAVLGVISITTSEHYDTAGGKIYMTHIGGNDYGNTGQCQEDSAAFANTINPAGDFSSSDTAQIYYTSTN